MERRTQRDKVLIHAGRMAEVWLIKYLREKIVSNKHFHSFFFPLINIKLSTVVARVLVVF